jgi:undecaprenyl-diphosphatase
MNFPESIQHVDEQVFYVINQQWVNSFLDTLLPPVRDKNFWLPLYGLIAILLSWKYKSKSLPIIFVLLINFAASDQLSSAVFKPLFQRERPCQNSELKDEVRLLISCGVGKSFPSSHATNTFGFAMLLSLLFYRKYKWILPLAFLWAFLVSYAQIYVGLHYPLDIIGGMLLGISISAIIYFAAKLFLFPRIRGFYI